jgi:hypothetical protein
MILQLLGAGIGNTLLAAPQQQTPSTVRTDALVLVNSASGSYSGFQRFIQPYLDQFGIPYTVLDIAAAAVPSSVGEYAVIIVGHRQLDMGDAYLDATEEGYLSAAVNAGTGLVNFDNDLADAGGAPRYAFVQDVFGFGYGGATSGSGVTFPGLAPHYITARHAADQTITTGTMTLAGITLPAGATGIALSGTQPFLAVKEYGSGRGVQWGSYDWMSHSVKGPVFGLDDLVWRSIVWAARKPFVMQGMPPFATIRMDDVAGPLNWAHIANEVGFKPWLGLFINELDAAETADLAGLVNSGKATASVHAFSTPDFFYYDHYSAANFSDAVVASNFATATAWHQANNIPISKYVVGHFYELGSNVFEELGAWGVEYIATTLAPGSSQGASPWLPLGPYRKYESGPSNQQYVPLTYADFVPIPGHPELDGRFFNCMTEMRDISGYEWYPNNLTVAQSIAQGTEWLTRAYDSMVLGTLFSHEYALNAVSEADWRVTMQGIAANLAPYQPRYVTLDYACQYARAMYTSNIASGEYDPGLKRVTLNFSGAADIPTEYYLFTEEGGVIREQLTPGVPAFSGSTQVSYTIPGPLHHITVSPNPASVVAGGTQQFSAQGYDIDNNPIPNLSYAWSVVNGGGSIDANGLFTAGSAVGTYVDTVVATVGGISGAATVNVTAPVMDHFSIQAIPSPQYVGVPFRITVTARDAANNLVAGYSGTAALSDSTGTLTPTVTGAFSGGSWSGYVSIGQAASGVTITAADGAYTGVSNSFSVQVMRPCPCTIWNASATPESPNVSDGIPIEIGVKFRSDVDGYITGLRFYKGNLNTGTHTGHLWAADGTLLAEAVFTGESASGWQEVTLASPVVIQANTTYVASYFSPSGYFAITPDYFLSAVDNLPLHALANGADGPNGVYRYSSSGFPTQTWTGRAPNYWVDVVFTTQVGADTTPPTVASVSPANNATGVNVETNVQAIFSEALDSATVTGASFELRTTAGALVPAAVTYDSGTRTATLDPTAALAYSTGYTATIKGGASGVKDLAGNALAADYVWSFTTAAPPPPPPDEGPGGPILVVASSTNPFGRYYAEILRAEGLNAFTVTDISNVTAGMLANYDVVILAEMSLTSAQATLFGDWVTAGGNLIAMRPDAQLAGLLGITPAGGTLSDAYLLVDTANAPGAGIVNQTIQFHGAADRYTLNGATAIATLYSNATTPTTNPAVTWRSVGTNGGQAAMFAYDLARSVVYTRQGNPAWAGDERDGRLPMRSDDLFYGAKSGDVQPDWVNLSKVAIPQADEQQRLLANMILTMNADRKPLPRFWYFPRDEKAAVVMTGDDHFGGGTAGRFDSYIAQSAPGCSVTDWECIRSTSYIYDNSQLTDAQVASYSALGFEIASHINTNCTNYTLSSLTSNYTTQLNALQAKYLSLPAPRTVRTHCIVWSDWVSQPEVELAHGIRLDTNYYFWPPEWIQNRPGMFTGSGMPMRFARTDGTMVDVYQATTQMTDESSQEYPYTINTLLDNALGPQGYYGFFVANMHTDNASSPGSDAIIAAAQARGVPVISARQLLEWVDGRNASSFGNLSWNGATLTFDIAVGAGANGLRAMLPLQSDVGPLTGLTRNGSPHPYTTETIKGVQYAVFAASAGSYAASYAVDNTPPVISNVTATPQAGGTAIITWTTDEAANSLVQYGLSPDALTLSVSDPALVISHQINLSGLNPSTTYYYRVTSADGANNSATWPAIENPPATFTSAAASTPTPTATQTATPTATLAPSPTPTATATAVPPSASFVDTTSANFSAGTVGTCTISQIGDGEVMLSPAINTEFSGGTLPAGWGVTPWNANGSYSVSGGVININDSLLAYGALPASYGPGRSLEFVATFRPNNSQHIGFGTDLNNAPWAIFSTGWPGGSVLIARTMGAFASETQLPAVALGVPHRFRIEWTSSAISYYVDGNLVATHTSGIPTSNMRPVASDSTNPGPDALLTIDWLRMSPYTSPCTFDSRVFDAGEQVTWSTISWTDATPTGTSLTISVRTGDTPTPDGSWSAFTAKANGSDIGTTSRYIQYRAVLSTTDSSQTPLLEQITLGYNPGSGATPTATFTPTPSPTATATETFTPTPSPTATATATFTATPSPTPTATFTPTSSPTATATATFTPTPSPTATATFTPTPTFTPTAAPTSTGFQSPSANAPVTSNSGDNNGFEVNPANAYLSDNLYAVDNNSGTGTQTSCASIRKDRHIYYNFNLNIPTSAVIRGLEVRLEAKADSTSGSPRFCVQVSWDGGASWTAAKTSANLTTSDALYTLGGPTDTWGRSWTAGQFANTSFRVRLVSVASSTARDFSLDWVAVNVYYQP